MADFSASFTLSPEVPLNASLTLTTQAAFAADFNLVAYYKLTAEQLTAINTIIIDGDGTKALFDDGVYKTSYTASQTDAFLALKADKSNTYTITQVNAALALKADTTALIAGLATKQDTLTAGTGIMFIGDTIYATGTAVVYFADIWGDPTDNTKLNAILEELDSDISTHIADTDNPHSVTKTQVGLGNCDNTSDADKPISDATQDALDLKADLSGATFTGDISANNLSGTNTGDETDSTIKTKLGITTLSGSNTGDQDLSGYALLSGATFSGQISAPNIIAGNTIYGGTISANLDTITKSGLYTCYGTATGVPSADYSWFVLHQNSNVGTTSATQRAVAYDNTTLRVYERVKTTTWGTWVLQGSGGGSGSSLSAGMSLFGLYEELPSAAYVWGDAGKQELNNASTNYSNLVDNITGGLIPSGTIAAWDAAYAANPDNAVPFWGYDSATDKVIVPNIPRGYAMTAAGSLANVGAVLQNAVPNVTGSFITVHAPDAKDAFGAVGVSSTRYGGTGTNSEKVSFDASRSSAAYGRDSTTRVRNDQIQMRVMFYVGAEVSPQEASQIAAANVLSELHSKLDKPSTWSNDDFAAFRKQITSLNWADKVEFTTYPYTAPNDGVLFVNKSGGQSWTINGIIIHNGGNDASNYEGPSQIPVSKGDTISAQADGGIMTFVPFYGQAGTNNLILGINYYGKFATAGDLDTASASLIETPLGKGRWALVGNDIDGYVRYYTAPLGGSFSEFTWEEGAPDTTDGGGGMPDYSAGVSVTFPFTAPTDGLLQAEATGAGSSNLKINDTLIMGAYISAQYGQATLQKAIISKGEKVVLNAGTYINSLFFPLKGAN